MIYNNNNNNTIYSRSARDSAYVKKEDTFLPRKEKDDETLATERDKTAHMHARNTHVSGRRSPSLVRIRSGGVTPTY